MKFIRPSQIDINDAIELKNETKRKYSTHFVQKLIKELEVRRTEKETDSASEL